MLSVTYHCRLVAIAGIVFAGICTYYMDQLGLLGSWAPVLVVIVAACVRLWACRWWAVQILCLVSWWQALWGGLSFWPFGLAWTAWSAAVTLLLLRYREEWKSGW